MAIGNNIRSLRFHAAEMTQQALAEKVGVTRQTIIAIEQNKYSPSLEVAFRIAHTFGVP
jgi:putative transcriptional regulator